MKTIHTLRYFLWVMLVMFLAACQKEDITVVDQASGVATAEQREPPSKPVSVDLPPVIRVVVPPGATQSQLKDAIENAIKVALKDSVDANGKKLDQHSYNLVIKALQDSVTMYNMYMDYLEMAAFAQVRFVMSKVGGQIHVYVIRYQVIKNDSPTMRAHENGHSDISKAVAQGCSEKAKQNAESKEKNPVKVNNMIRADLNTVDAEAQKAYDLKSNYGQNGTPEQQKLWAQEAAQAAINKYLAS